MSSILDAHPHVLLPAFTKWNISQRIKIIKCTLPKGNGYGLDVHVLTVKPMVKPEILRTIIEQFQFIVKEYRDRRLLVEEHAVIDEFYCLIRLVHDNSLKLFFG